MSHAPRGLRSAWLVEFAVISVCVMKSATGVAKSHGELDATHLSHSGGRENPGFPAALLLV